MELFEELSAIFSEANNLQTWREILNKVHCGNFFYCRLVRIVVGILLVPFCVKVMCGTSLFVSVDAQDGSGLKLALHQISANN